MIILLAFILANPNCQDALPTGEKENRTNSMLILIDNSLSNGYWKAEGQVLKLIKKTVKEIISNEKEDFDYISVMALFGRDTYDCHFTNSLFEIEKTITMIRLSQSDGQLKSRFNQIIQTYNEEEYDFKNVLIFSDFQKYDWNDIIIEHKLDNIDLHVFRFNTENAKNLQIYDIAVDKELIHFPGDGLGLNLILKNYSSARESCTINFYVNNDFITSLQTEIPPEKEELVKYSIKSPVEGYQTVKASITPDRFEYDNDATFTTIFKNRIYSLLLENSNDPFIRYALQHSQAPHSDLKRLNWIIHNNIMNYNRLYDIIVIHNLSETTPDKIEFIKRHIQKGKPVIFIFGNHEKPVSVNRLFRQLEINQFVELDKVFHKSVKLTSNSKNDENSIYPVDYKSLNNIYFKKYYTTQVGSLLRFDSLMLTDKSGKTMPFISECYDEKYNLIFLNASIDEENSNILFSNTFPLIFNNLIERNIAKDISNSKVINRITHTNKDFKEGNLQYLTLYTLKSNFKGFSTIFLYDNQLEISENFKIKRKKIIKTSNFPIVMSGLLFLVLLFFLEHILSYRILLWQRK